MNNKLPKRKRPNNLAILIFIFSVLTLNAQANSLGIPGVPQIPQIPAFLPMAMDVPMGKKLPIDGEWMINDIRKRIRIEGGRAYAVDSWVHLFVLKIGPMMVVSQDWQRVKSGEYKGQDLPLAGPFTATLAPSGNLNVSVQGMLGPVNLTLSPVRVDSQSKFEREKRGGRDSVNDDSYSDEDDSDMGEEEYDEEENYNEEEEYYDDEEYSEGDEEEYYDDEEYDDDEEEYEEEAAPTKVKAKRYKKAKKGCEGKQVYRSGTRCYACPKGYKRTSLTRKMTHPEACKKRGLGLNKEKTSAKYVWGANGCPKHQFKHKGYCMKCPKGTKRIHVAGIDTGKCRIQ